jgi:hypothetical protein
MSYELAKAYPKKRCVYYPKNGLKLLIRADNSSEHREYVKH